MFTQEPVTLRLAVERRKPQVTIRQLLVARIEEGVIKYQATFFYSVRYSGVKSLRIDVPADVAPLLRNTTAGIHEKTIDPPPADLEKNMVAWGLTGEGELLGDGQIDLGVGEEARQARRGQGPGSDRAAAHSPRRRSGLGPDRAGEGGNARLPGGRGLIRACGPSTRSAIW